MTIAPKRAAQLVSATLLVAGVVVLQTLIGGRGLLFSLPGFVLIGLAALVAVVAANRSRILSNPAALSVSAIFFGYILARALASPAYFARPDLFSVVAALVVYGLVATVLTSSSVRALIFAALILFAVAHVLVGIMQFTRADNFMPIPFLQRVDYGQRASGLYICPNHLAGLLEVLGIFGLSLTCWSRWRVWQKLVVAYATGACYVGLALTGSRGGYLSAVTSLVVFGILSLVVIRAARPGDWKRFAVIGLLALTLLVTAAGLLIGRNWFLGERAGRLTTPDQVRPDLWHAAVQQWKLAPVFGTGSGTYRFYGREFRTERMQNDPIDVHNDYLHLLCEYGLIGGAGFLLFFALHTRHAWRSLRWMAERSPPAFGAMSSNRLGLLLGALAATAAYVVHSAVDFNLHIPANAILMALVFGILANPGIAAEKSEPRAFSLMVPRWAIGVLAVALIAQSLRFYRGEYYTETARAALRDENPQEAFQLTEKARIYEQRNPELFFYQGRAALALAHAAKSESEKKERYQQAVAAFQMARHLAPLDGTYALNLAYTFDEMGLFPQAEQMFTEARERDPRSMAVAELYRAHQRQQAASESDAGSAL